ncbi:AMP-binding protein [Kosakonia sp. BYX6]|uniref:AMP-binding protein n=1 Tax=Kosakonia calanthes TaxID=3139408 RepID=A0ABZ3BC74_9ENTR
MNTFWQTQQHDTAQLALKDDRGASLSYGELTARVDALASHIPARSLVFVFCQNQVEAVVGYLACLQSDAVALLLDNALDNTLAQQLIDTYKPSLIWQPTPTVSPDGGCALSGLQTSDSGTVGLISEAPSGVLSDGGCALSGLQTSGPGTVGLISEAPSGVLSDGGCALSDLQTSSPGTVDLISEAPSGVLSDGGCALSDLQTSGPGTVGLISEAPSGVLSDGGCALSDLQTSGPGTVGLISEAPSGVLSGDGGYQLHATGLTPWPLHDELALLMTTSGSTGSPKLVRLSKRNLQSNAESIAHYLDIDARERGLVSLPINYVYGLSIINSHLHAGASLLLTGYSVMQRELWEFVRTERASSFAGVPYTWEMLRKLRFMRMDLPDLRTLTQAGGKLAAALQQEYTEYAMQNGKRFIVMYGAAEATSRMAWLAPEHAASRYGFIGKPIPGGEFLLLGDDNHPITTPDTQGELIYRGANVALGYAECGEDLALGDTFAGTLHTGDIATVDSDGFYRIVGRKKRFLKIFGNRVGLDEMESLLKTAFADTAVACDGRDDLLCIFITDESLAGDVKQYAAGISKLHASAFRVIALSEIPKNPAGKTLYHRLKEYVPVA